ncbi:DNA excision repair protein ERCC-8 [Nannizzia gypsea CBS 118893]|uniref:DNA excision repair protein ERCC-8 n=1 Tax=Arthroderma gypseum (strain ATCC MYA-4604 / CBS 118893) TaxID=535722 RepID=E4UQG9_ARTGP|nr:DNA excision repair protein ERCC-8 [Nannizzia gypsea CBS 118893]EFR00039.1 DNA excision repair protein ERCC-8 [Nannizzia gypsea CBS 118893]
MNSYIFNRSQGSIRPSQFHLAQCTRLVHGLAPALGIRFSAGKQHESQTGAADVTKGSPDTCHSDLDVGDVWAHKAGVNVLAIDQYEKRYMISGGADTSIHLWDLESRGTELSYLHKPIASVSKQTNTLTHTHALTSLSIYPFDPTPSTILSTSHDATLKLSSLGESDITTVHTFNIHSTPYSHSLSAHQASHLLIAVGTSENAIRLLDLRSGLSTHALPAHTGAVISVQWAPHNPHIIASASKDNRVIIFDVRRGGRNSAIASFDMDDSVGVLSPESLTNQKTGKLYNSRSRAHNGTVTGVRWTSNGSHLLSAGQDSRIRVWDASTGANTLVHFGPRIRNSASLHLAERAPLVLPESNSAVTLSPGHEAVLWPNFNDQDDRGEIFMFGIHDGVLLKHLRVPGLISREKLRGRPTALSAARINALAWRSNGASGEGMEMFSAHGDGTIRSWVSQTQEDEDFKAETTRGEREEKKRKRDILNEVYRNLIQPGISFT